MESEIPLISLICFLQMTSEEKNTKAFLMLNEIILILKDVRALLLLFYCFVVLISIFELGIRGKRTLELLYLLRKRISLSLLLIYFISRSFVQVNMVNVSNKRCTCRLRHWFIVFSLCFLYVSLKFLDKFANELYIT